MGRKAVGKFAVAALLAVAATGSTAYAASPEEGQSLFESTCSGCHTIGGGDTVGPDLAGVGDRRDRAWLVQFLLAPDKVIASGDPIAAQLLAQFGVPMPNLGLTDDQVASLLLFLGVAETESPATTATETVPAETTAPETTPAETTPAVPGDAAAGQRLFTGADRLENGGPPCLSCHSIAGIGSLGGGSIGPDLTGAYGRYNGAQGLDGVLAAIAFPTMAPIYINQELTAPERASLIAFLAQAESAQRPGSSVWKLFLLGLGGGFVLLAFGMAVWRGRLLAVRRQLVRRPRSGRS